MPLTIGVDIDDVVADLIPAWVNEYNFLWNDNLTRANFSDWDLTKCVKPECGAKVYDILRWPNLYDFVKPVADALDGVNTLRARGHTLVFVTACGYDAETITASAGAKFAWLQRHGFLPNDRKAAASFIVAANKSLIKADALIDDRASTIESFPGTGILLSRAHNASYQPSNDEYRAHDWEHVIHIVDRIDG